MRNPGDIVATMGTQIPRCFSPLREKPQRTCPSPFIPCKWHDQIPFQSYGTSIARPGPSFPIQLLRRSPHLPIQHKSRSIQRSGLQCGVFVCDIWSHHIYATYLARQPILFTAYPTSSVPVNSVFVCYREYTLCHFVVFILFQRPPSHSEMDEAVPPTEGSK